MLRIAVLAWSSSWSRNLAVLWYYIFNMKNQQKGFSKITIIILIVLTIIILAVSRFIYDANRSQACPTWGCGYDYGIYDRIANLQHYHW